MTTETKFNKAAELIQGLPKSSSSFQPSTAEQLHFYSHYKQATIGDVNTSRPGTFDFAGKAKWDAWKKVEGKSKEDAMKEYVDAFIAILDKADNDEAKKLKEEVESA